MFWRAWSTYFCLCHFLWIKLDSQSFKGIPDILALQRIPKDHEAASRGNQRWFCTLPNWRLSVPQEATAYPLQNRAKLPNSQKRFMHEPKSFLVQRNFELLNSRSSGNWNLQCWCCCCCRLHCGCGCCGCPCRCHYHRRVYTISCFWESLHSDKICSSEFDDLATNRNAWIPPWCKFEMDTVSVSW